MKLSVYSKLERVKNLLKFLIEKFNPICCLCGGKMGWRSFFPKLSGLEIDEWTIHHLDHNRQNDKIENQSPCHRDCHRRHHREEQLFKELNPKKKYHYKAFSIVSKKITKTYKV